MKVITYKNSLGFTSVLYPQDNVYQKDGKFFTPIKGHSPPDGFELATVEQIAVKDVPKGLSYSILDIPDVPSDKTFRNAWKTDLTIDMDKARDIHMNNIRAVRDEKLKKLDIETMKGRDVQDQKQILRDIPKNTDLSKAKTPEELKAIWPEQLL